jgi:hypothetical protein
MSSLSNAFATCRPERGNMSAESLLIIVLVGLIAGWIAGQIAQGTGFRIMGESKPYGTGVTL